MSDPNVKHRLALCNRRFAASAPTVFLAHFCTVQEDLEMLLSHVVPGGEGCA